ncbi:MAG: Gfo/Idh/MocA family oxidoreductase [Candidatus Omnitrophica bacterium]|nr:Gfo/Idh/MocA family oxidoreductase [Candidatus Omnitrophota bacterium]MCB9781725.1 Gfo/Idh/MocA family oxidoreductase [Candidatus Omnitrophota bacterium]
MPESGTTSEADRGEDRPHVRWGILGTGDITRQFASDLNEIEQAELIAIGSRARETAERFGDTHKIPRRYSSYEELAADPDIDLVYIGTPHPYHHDNTLLCLENGRGVVCEKPFALNATEAREMIEFARGKDLFLMEAMWTYCFPAIREVTKKIQDGAIGEVRMVKADFCFRIEFDPMFRLFNAALGGGALLDVGVYTVALVQLIFGRKPEAISAEAHLGETGVDEQAGIVMKYPNGEMAVLTCASRTELPQEALILGTEGWIRIPTFSQPDTLTIGNSKREETLRFERIGYGYAFEALEAMDAFYRGDKESNAIPLDSTLMLMETLDEIREIWGLRYPSEISARKKS